MVKNQIKQGVNNGQGLDRFDTNVISISGYSRKLSQLNSPIENSYVITNLVVATIDEPYTRWQRG